MNPDLRARILAEAKRTPSPTRAEHDRRVTLVVGAGAVAAAALFFVMGGFTRGVRPIELVAFAAGWAFVAAAVLTRLSTMRPGSMLPRPRVVIVSAVVAAGVALAAGALVAASLWPAAASEDVPARTHVACAAMTLVQAALPLAVLVVPRRGSDPVHPVLTGAALGMTAGAWSAMMAYLRCPHAAASHGLVAHVLPVVVLAAVGAVLGRVLLSVRR